MEREGTGYDMMYDRLLASGRAVPEVSEGVDSVKVVVPRRIVHAGVIRLIADAEQRYQLTQRERIALGTLAQTEGLTAVELAARLELDTPEAALPWFDRLMKLGLVEQTGRTKATRYFVPPKLLRSAGLAGRTTLARMEPHRLQALIVEDLKRHPNSSSPEIHGRVGPEIHAKTLKRALDALVAEGTVEPAGEHRWRRYSLASSRTGA
jgi:ATP-dependent DNA helicase RecG